MADFIYRVPDELSHAYQSKYMTRTKYTTYNPQARHDRYMKTREIVGRPTARRVNPYGNYKSPYYDPVKRKAYYEAHKDQKTRPYGVGASEKAKSGRGGGSGKKGGSGKGGSGKGGSGRGSQSAGSKANMQSEIEKLREQSQLETEAQREAARRKIEDLQSDLQSQIKKLREDARLQAEKEDNAAEVRGITQGLKAQIENLQGKTGEEAGRISASLQEWISHEKDSLERRIAAIYSNNGKQYTPRLQADKQNASASRNKEVGSRADSIYKRKSKK